jgi:perosamine synthetase
MCLTDNEEIAGKMRILRDHGQHPDKRYWYDVVGFNYRMTNIQAAIGVAQVDRLEQLINVKRQIAAWYKASLQDLSEDGYIIMAPEMFWAKNVYWMYSILLTDRVEINRDEVISRLADTGIETRPFFYPLNLLPPYKSSKRFPVAEMLGSKGINLPSGYGIDREDVNCICRRLESILGGSV